MATLHFVFGRPGAGKTSLARALAAQVPALLFCEDEWLAALGGAITTLDAYLAASQRVRGLIAPTATRVLALGTSVVFDFAGNTVRDRAWVRSIIDAAGVDHALHVLDVPVDECRRRLHARNADQPAGLFFGHVSDALFDAVVPHVALPSADEGFALVAHAIDPRR